MGFYSEVAMERAMKVQEVILWAMAKRITWWQAAEILGISCRSLRRWKVRYERWGYDGLYDRRRGKPSTRRVPSAVVEEVLRLYQEQYFDCNVRHFHEKLQDEHGIRLGYTWVQRALHGSGSGANAAEAASAPAPAGDAAAPWMGVGTGGSETTDGMTCW